jgi:hypothetical protein
MNDDQAKKFHRLTMDVESDKFALLKLQELAADLKVRYLPTKFTNVIVPRIPNQFYFFFFFEL